MIKRKSKYKQYERWLRVHAEHIFRRKHRKNHRKTKPSFDMTYGCPRKFRRHTYFAGIELKQKYREKQNRRTRLLKRLLPSSLHYLVFTKQSPFYINELRANAYKSHGRVHIPESFSMIHNEHATIDAFKQILSGLLLEDELELILDYQNCSEVDLSVQMLLDVILLDYMQFRRKSGSQCKKEGFTLPILSGQNIEDTSIQKMLFSVGSPRNLGIKQLSFPDVIPFSLKVHNKKGSITDVMRIGDKEFTTTDMVDYINECLARVNKRLMPDRIDDLCTVIGEILINAEEHSTTNFWFAMGYFQEHVEGNLHNGVFRLVIMNFGHTIYEKFKDPECPNKEYVEKMQGLSYSYTKRKWFSPGKFEEESLWTLYALQEGITTVPVERSRKRGNGSIRFIESFFKIKGNEQPDKLSEMVLCSGNARILFDGTYSIQTKINKENERFKVMTFNESGDIAEKPDNKYVKNAGFYFPGTFISAKILLSDDDIEQINNY